MLKRGGMQTEVVGEAVGGGFGDARAEGFARFDR
jgi:hypothetical protein